jgi:dihydrofolate reductase
MIAFWPRQPEENRMAAQLNAAPKLVASRTATDFTWNAAHLDGELVPAVERLKGEGDEPLVILGSGEIVRQLLAARLIDELSLFVHPLVLGSGGRVFPELTEPLRFELRELARTSTGVLVLNYARKLG